MNPRDGLRARAAQAGATTIEFALVMVLFMALTLGVVDFSRLLFAWSAATEATREGARYAVVCDDMTFSDAVLQRMRGLLPELTAANVDIEWAPAGCTVATCEGVTVSIQSLNFNYISPFGIIAEAGPIAFPGFSTFVSREAMRQDPYSCTTPL